MVNYKIDEKKDVYKNDDLKFLVDITSFIHFPIFLKEASTLNHIDLYLSKTQPDCKGSLVIEVRCGEKNPRFKVDYVSIVEKTPLRLVFEDKPFVESSFSVVIKTDQADAAGVALWTNPNGPCIVVNSILVRDIVMESEPQISIILPVYKTDLDLLKQTIASVQDQYYKNWELCIVDDGSQDRQLEDYLNSIKSDHRITTLINKKNRGIAAASNDGIGMSMGPYIGFLDHEDILTKDALLEVAFLINEKPDADMIYTDEDKINLEGKLSGVFYKPDWNYGLFLSHMYTCHFGVYRRKIADEIHGFREGYDGSQDYDFVLRFYEKTQKIYHIPKVLYHWRIVPGSTSQNIRNKPQARISAVRALSDHLHRIGRSGTVSAGPFQGHYHVSYDMTWDPKVTIIIPFKDRVELLKNLVYTIDQSSYENFDVLLIDNGSTGKDTAEFIWSLEKHSIYYKIDKYDKPFNFSAINNYGASRCRDADVLLFLNNDMEVMHPDWLEQMLQHFERPEVGAVGAKLLYLDHRIQHAGIFVGINGVAAHGHKNMWDWQPGYFGRPHCIQDIAAVTGACLMVKKKYFDAVGGFDLQLSKAFNDIDLCMKIRAMGKKIVYTPYAQLYHIESASRGYDKMEDKDFREAIEYMITKWNILSYKDPNYNPNLTRIREDFSFGA